MVDSVYFNQGEFTTKSNSSVQGKQALFGNCQLVFGSVAVGKQEHFHRAMHEAPGGTKQPNLVGNAIAGKTAVVSSTYLTKAASGEVVDSSSADAVPKCTVLRVAIISSDHNNREDEAVFDSAPNPMPPYLL